MNWLLKDRRNKRTSNLATMDNGTLVEVFKYLNYSQLAKNSFVSKKFWNLIRTHRHRLALLYVESIRMTNFRTSLPFIEMFNKQLNPEEYNEWVIRNNYSKQIPLENQVAGTQSTIYDSIVYELGAEVIYNDPDRRLWLDHDTTRVFFASAKFEHENWPLFEHFLRLLIDPSIYISWIVLSSQNDVANLLARATSSDRNRLQCEQLNLYFDANAQKFIGEIKGHVTCEKLEIHNYYYYYYSDSNCDEELLDFFMTGANCTSEITVKHYALSKVVINFVQKFMDLKKLDEGQMVQSIKSRHIQEKPLDQNVHEVLKRNYAGFIVKEQVDEEEERAVTIFDFVNSDIGKKMRLTIETKEYERDDSDDIETCFLLQIENL
ncbi:hypothetical protein DdX_16051 [Ditylenchus destructor]|uniref:F-box domain-containing protein n=1 Tax=Ditylenchus destructor TaxID=166010 RepID=A0AAD4R0B0_9BILA|nr:hypothetical protein DdX_16051 [Ditylenchus destructor]